MNNMYVDEILKELSLLEKLEQMLISQRIVFEKIVVLYIKDNREKLKVQYAMYL